MARRLVRQRPGKIGALRLRVSHLKGCGPVCMSAPTQCAARMRGRGSEAERLVAEYVPADSARLRRASDGLGLSAARQVDALRTEGYTLSVEVRSVWICSHVRTRSVFEQE